MVSTLKVYNAAPLFAFIPTYFSRRFIVCLDDLGGHENYSCWPAIACGSQRSSRFIDLSNRLAYYRSFFDKCDAFQIDTLQAPVRQTVSWLNKLLE
jgi:hypothetical protein